MGRGPGGSHHPRRRIRRVVGDDEGFLLESVDNGDRWSRWSFIGRRPQGTLVSKGGRLQVIGDLGIDIDPEEGMLTALERLLAHYRSPELDGLPPLHGGLIGYLGYDVVREVEHLPDVPTDDLGHPDAVISMIGELAVYDHWRQRVTLLANVVINDGTDLRAAYDTAVAQIHQLAVTVPEPSTNPDVAPGPLRPDPEVTSPMGEAEYSAAVETAREYILAGDIFQVVLAQRFDLDLDAEAFDLYRVLRQVNPSPYMYFLRIGGLHIVGASPEPMVQLRGDRVISRPIAGTRPRGRTDEEDRLLGAELIEHPKEVAEHVMLVDLARNDIGRVVEFGSLQIDEMMTLEKYSHVMHLTSQVSGARRRPFGDRRAARHPSRRHALGSSEGAGDGDHRRTRTGEAGPYGGVVGYLDFSGNIDTAITIRTMLVSNGTASVQAGAGVVADSVAVDEHLECQNKAKALLAAVPAARRMSAARRQARQEASS